MEVTGAPHGLTGTHESEGFVVSGHSKWHNIKIKKSKTDQQRGKVFSKLAREIIIAAKAGGGDPGANMRLRAAVDRAREASMPNDNIQRAIQRGTGGGEGAAFEEVTYEGMGPGGVAVLVQAQTDNRNRTASEIRNIFTKAEGSLGASVGWLFEKKGVITMKKAVAPEEEVLTKAVDAGAEDMKVTSDEYEITVAPEGFAKVKHALEAAGYALISAEVTLVPKSTVPVAGKDAQKVIRLLEALEDHDDVQHVYANFDIPDEVLEQVG
jgi:YebC/PmpR family DNA-binding regulatory protein